MAVCFGTRENVCAMTVRAHVSLSNIIILVDRYDLSMADSELAESILYEKFPSIDVTKSSKLDQRF